MNTTDRYAKIREALEMRPTPGPWTYDRRGDRKTEELPKITTVAYCCDYVIGLPSRYPGGDYRYDPSGSPEADTAFIAACDPDTIRALLAERDALAAENERLRKALEQIEQQLDYGQIDTALHIARRALTGGE